MAQKREKSPIAEEVMKNYFYNDYTYAIKMFKLFLDETLPEARLLQKLYAANQFTAIKKIAHKIKPAFKMMGAESVANNLDILEQINDKQEIRAIVEKVMISIQITQKKVEEDYKYLVQKLKKN